MSVEIAQDARSFALERAAQQLARLRAHEAGACLGDDHEELHDYRVALRRLRTVARVFETVLPPPFTSLQPEMGWLDDLLGAVRDLDVQIELLESGPQLQQPGVRRDLERRRDEARQELCEALTGPRYRALLAGVEEATDPALAIPAEPDIRRFAPGALRSVYRRYHSKAKRLSGSSTAEQMHEVRRRARRLRYTTEFLHDLYGAPAKHLVKSVQAAQDVLGGYQDCVTSIQYLCELAPDTHGDTVTLIAARQARMRKLRAELPDALERVKGAWQELRPRL